MQYRPTAAELLDIIAELLEDEVIDAVSGPVQHKVRVAANLARILQREAELGPATDAQERTVIASQPEDAFCVFDGGRDFQTVANDACICEESRNVIITKGRDRLGFEARIGPFETLALFQDCFPRQPCLVDFEDQTLEEPIVMQKRKSVLEVVVVRVNCV